MKRRILLTILSFLIFFSSHEKLDAYHPDHHRKITTSTIDQMMSRLNTYMNDSIGETDYLGKKILGKPMRNWIEDGSWWEDLSVGSYLDLLTGHYYNPYTNKGLTEGGITIGVSAYDRADDPINYWGWKSARENFYVGLTSRERAWRETKLADSFEALGHVIHLIQDMAVPAHTRDDMHLIEPYESYTEDK